MMGADKILHPKKDIIFKLLFGDERNIELLTDFLKSVLRLPADDYDEVTIIDPHLLREFDADKLGILDVKVTTKSKKVIDIEIQVDPIKDIYERVSYYTSKMITEQIGSSDDYHKIKRVISIIITNYTFIKETPKYHHRFVLYDPDNKVEFSDIIEVNTLELKKIPEAEDGTQLWNWLKFLSAERKEELDMVAEKNPVVKKAVVRLMELSNDERTRMLYESRQKLEWDIKSRERGARDEGRNEGRNERNIEIARNAIKMNMSFDDIIKLTGLTHEEISDIQNSK